MGTTGGQAENRGASDMGTFTVGQLTERLFACFPREWAESWDKCGLLVGDGTQAVTGVALALDPTCEAIRQAHQRGCNMLLTHHPAYIEAPQRLVDRAHGGNDAAQRVRQAIACNVALVAMHTNLDRSEAAGRQLAGTLGIAWRGCGQAAPGTPARLLPGCQPPAFGWLVEPAGDVACTLSPNLTLGQLARHCASSYDVLPRVWGASTMLVGRIALCNGSSSSLIGDIVESGATCVVTGEISYHNACELALAGIGIIELGHDVSEYPLVGCLRDALLNQCGFDGLVEVLCPDSAWWQPEMEES